jgi:hypothetical protein
MDIKEYFKLFEEEPIKVTGEAAVEHSRKIDAEHKIEKEAYLEQKKKEALESGKELFDKERLLQLYDFYHTTKKNLEYEYYCSVYGQDSMTLQEFADAINKRDIEND